MIKLTYLIIPFFLLNITPSLSLAYNVQKINKYHVHTSQKVADELGMSNISVGSSLKLFSKSNNKLIFYGITDRGPNATFKENNQHYLLSAKPNFIPSILKIELNLHKQQASIVDYIKLSYKDKYITGLPNIKGYNSPNQIIETPIDVNNKKINFKGVLGLDTEGLALDHKGNFYVVDEYFPSLNYVNNKGEILKTYTINKGLPEIIKWRMANRGFEGVAVAPNGKIYITLEGILDIEKETIQLANFIRIIEFDPFNNTSRMFAYPYDQDTYIKPSKVKIGDIDALNNKEFLIIEQGVKKDGTFRNAIYKINIKDAVDIADVKLSNMKDLEYGALLEVKKYFVKKDKVFEARDHGWSHKKMEDLAIINPKTIALINDNDFGVAGHEVYHDNKNQKKFKLKLKDTNLKGTDLWIVKFKENL